VKGISEQEFFRIKRFTCTSEYRFFVTVDPKTRKVPKINILTMLVSVLDKHFKAVAKEFFECISIILSTQNCDNLS
jgi:hypothetical protein